MTKPKICAVCYNTLDRFMGQWVHTRELVGKKDHVCVPVDYDDERVRTMCDFCYDEVPKPEILTVPARDFQMPVIPTVSVGGWCACKTCGALIEADRWADLTDRAADSYISRNGGDRDLIHAWLIRAYAELRKNTTGPIRPWEPGDEDVS